MILQMATIEEIENQLNIALGKLGEAEKKLKEFEEGDDDGMLLKKLRRGRKELDEEDKYEKTRLEEEEKELKKDKQVWGEQVRYLQKELTKFNKGKGNEKIT